MKTKGGEESLIKTGLFLQAASPDPAFRTSLAFGLPARIGMADAVNGSSFRTMARRLPLAGSTPIEFLVAPAIVVVPAAMPLPAFSRAQKPGCLTEFDISFDRGWNPP